MDELNSRTALAPADLAPEAHKSIYVYCILHAMAPLEVPGFGGKICRRLKGKWKHRLFDRVIRWRNLGGYRGGGDLVIFSSGRAPNKKSCPATGFFTGENLPEYVRVCTGIFGGLCTGFTPVTVSLESIQYSIMYRGRFDRMAIKELAGVIS